MISMSLNNLTDIPQDLEILAKAGLNPSFYEILWGNYCHLDPDVLARLLEPLGRPLSLHIMWSRFMDLSLDELKTYALRLRGHIQALRPVRVSDHVGCFTVGTCILVVPIDPDYRRVDEICRKVELYQECIQMPLHLENFGSATDAGRGQTEFLAAVLQKTGCKLLFDVSNAVLAAKNGADPLDEVLSLAPYFNDLHVGGYSPSKYGDRLHDTHAADLSADTLAAMTRVGALGAVQSVVYEREYNRSVEAMVGDLTRLQASLAGAKK